MIGFLLDIAVLPGVLIFLAVIIILGILIYLASHHLYVKKLSKRHIQIGRVLFRTTASFLALLLSFTYANQRIDYFRIKHSLESEATKLVDIHIDLSLFDSPETDAIRTKLYDYVAVLLEEGWESITRDPFDSRTIGKFLEIYEAIHALDPKNPVQEQFKENLISDIDQISDFMQIRIYQTRPQAPFLVYIASFGFIIAMIFYSVYPPDRVSISLISIYNAFIGLVLYFIIMMNNPLIGPIQLKPDSFIILQEAIDSSS